MAQDARQFETAPSYVVFFDLWKDDLVYHQPGWLGPLRCQREMTKCGRPIGQLRPWFPAKLGPKIGRPCKGCYPGGSQ